MILEWCDVDVFDSYEKENLAHSMWGPVDVII